MIKKILKILLMNFFLAYFISLVISVIVFYHKQHHLLGVLIFGDFFIVSGACSEFFDSLFVIKKNGQSK